MNYGFSLGARVATGLLLTLLLPGVASAADYSDARCADAVDFAIRTAERRDEGKTEESLQQAIHDSPFVFQQQYPDMEISDMQTLVQQVFQNHWTRFIAARSTAQSCGKQLRTVMPPSPADPVPPVGLPSASAGGTLMKRVIAVLMCALPLLAQAQVQMQSKHPPAVPGQVQPPVQSLAHSDNWCADAVDLAMGAAQNRELGYSVDVIAGSIQRMPNYYERMFESLSVDDMQQIIEIVYEHQWSRFQAAQGISETCILK